MIPKFAHFHGIKATCRPYAACPMLLCPLRHDGHQSSDDQSAAVLSREAWGGYTRVSTIRSDGIRYGFYH